MSATVSSIEVVLTTECIVSMEPGVRLVPIGADSLVKVLGFKNRETGQLISTATGTVTVVNDETDAEITSVAFTALGSGDYSAAIPDTLSGLSEGLRLRLEIDLDGGAGFVHRKVLKAVAREVVDDRL